ncbi:hypothetical protein F383_15432 [Gossypium arboreum]|uniref:Uncharacterized protein n=1 Tax=Gossypium arboreum TaxID=29729 RepID=A0A0B0PZM1_GOSAR|nr:hypothetical protein F383_15432 [Gossypium arboreum]
MVLHVNHKSMPSPKCGLTRNHISKSYVMTSIDSSS